MDDQFNIQVKFFNEIKGKITPNLVLVDIVADELNISTDSAYRRIRGETSLSLEELKKLCTKFGISMDALFTSTSDSVIFSYRAINPEKFDYKAWFDSITQNMKMLSVYDLKEIIYGAKDIPLFYFFIMPKLAAFKLFFWMRNINNFPGMEDLLFDPGIIDDDTLKMAGNVWRNYLSIPSTEIWSEEAITITLRQIEYYYNSGRFRDKSDVFDLLDEYKTVIHHVQKQAEVGGKFDLNSEPDRERNNFKLYFNEVIIMDNTVYFNMGDFGMVHLAHNVMNIISTTDGDFCRDTYTSLNNIIKNSTLISSSSEKERARFFKNMYDKIEELRSRIK